MDINYEYYKTFYYVAKYGNISLAARMLHDNQPNMSRSIKKLEAALGCTLLRRTKNGVELTTEGVKLYGHIKIAMTQIEIAEAELQSHKALESGLVSIGSTDMALRTFLLPYLKEFRRQFPGIRLNISNFTSSQAIASLKQGLVDFAVITTPAEKMQGLCAKSVGKIRDVAICGDFFAAKLQGKVSLAELAEFPLISMDAKTITFAMYQNWFAENNVEFEPSIETATGDQILPMVQNNLGIGFVPESFLAERFLTGIQRIELEQETPERFILVLKRNNGMLSLAANQLYRLLLQDTEQLTAVCYNVNKYRQKES